MVKAAQNKKWLLRRQISLAVVTLIALVISAGSAAAQSTDRNNPEPLRTSRIQGSKEWGSRKVYYYTFVVRPGEVSVLLIGSIGKSDGANVHIADVKLFELNANNLFSLNLIAERPSGARATGSITNSLRIARRQQLLMELTLYESTVRYQASIDGAVELEQAPLSRTPRMDRREQSDGSSRTPPSFPPRRDGSRERDNPSSGTGEPIRKEPRSQRMSPILHQIKSVK